MRPARNLGLDCEMLFRQTGSRVLAARRLPQPSTAAPFSRSIPLYLRTHEESESVSAGEREHCVEGDVDAPLVSSPGAKPSERTTHAPEPPL